MLPNVTHIPASGPYVSHSLPTVNHASYVTGHASVEPSLDGYALGKLFRKAIDYLWPKHSSESTTLDGLQSSKKRSVQLSNGFPSVFDLNTLNGTNGVVFSGVPFPVFRVGPNFSPGLPDDREFGLLGSFLSPVGDVNFDGISDFLFNAYGAGSYIYIIFGHAGEWGSPFNLTTLDGTDGINITGGTEITNSSGLWFSSGIGGSMGGIGDVNGDGISDFAIEGSQTTYPYGDYSGEISVDVVYVIFGQPGVWPSPFNVTSVDGTNGILLNGLNTVFGISGAGDINNDGIDDFVIGSTNAFVIFGKNGPWPSPLNLTTLNGTEGFIVNNFTINTWNATSIVGAAGDINADGIDDLFVGNSGASINGLGQTGSVSVIFGHTGTSWSSPFSLSSLNGTNGITVNPTGTYSDVNGNLGNAVCGPGDINGDGIDDLIFSRIGNPNQTPGTVYGIFGQSQPWPAVVYLDQLTSPGGFNFNGYNKGFYLGQTLAKVGDINHDGFNDFAVGAPVTNSPRTLGGTIEIFFGGHPELWSASAHDAGVNVQNGIDGFSILGDVANDSFIAFSFSGVGDINDDGISDFALGGSSSDASVYVIFGQNLPPITPSPISLVSPSSLSNPISQTPVERPPGPPIKTTSQGTVADMSPLMIAGGLLVGGFRFPQ